MPLTITVRFRHGTYDAAEAAGRAEWPPHPARLFCALVAAAAHDPGTPGFDADDAALRWLENAGAPLVLAAPRAAVAQTLRMGYAVTNKRDARSGSTVWPGRTNVEVRRWSGTPAIAAVAFEWPDALPDDATLWRLSRLARRVPYLGRSTCPVEIGVHDTAVERPDSWVVHRPVPIGTAGATDIRVPFPGYTGQLRDAYERGQRSWEIARTVAYAPPGPPVATPPAAGPYRDMVVWPMARDGAEVRGDRFLTILDVLRDSVLSRVSDPVPAQISGHGAADRPHIAFLPLLDVGHRHARGHLLGVAVAIPRDLDDADRRALLRGLLGERGDDPIRQLRAGAAGVFHLDKPDDEPPRAAGLDPRRWTRPSRTWTTVTPLMLDRFPKRRDHADLVADAVVRAGFPRPDAVTVAPAPLLPGAVALPRRGSIPPNRPRRPMLHCRIRFAEPVRGPVLAGSLRYLGGGLFAPEASRADS